MKLQFLFLFLITLASALTAQVETIDSTEQPEGIHLIQPIIESPALNANQARKRVQSQYNNWGISRLRLDSVMTKYTGRSVKICICDTGKPDHPDLSESIEGSANMTTATTDEDRNGHATHVAGIIEEIAPNAAIFFAKVLDDQGSGTATWVANGIDWCVLNNVDIINLSLGSASSSPQIKKSIEKAFSVGIFIVAAAGNEGKNDEEDTMGFPAKYHQTIAVGSINQSLEVSKFSSSGLFGDLVAPGERILSTWINGDYIVLSGTSMATPYVSGVIALYLESIKDVPIKEVFAVNTEDISPKGYDRYSFHGHTSPKLLFAEPITEEPPIEDIETPLDKPKWRQFVSMLSLVFGGIVLYFFSQLN